MLTNAYVILSIYEPDENRITNYTNVEQLQTKINRQTLVEERFVMEDVSKQFHNQKLILCSTTAFSFKLMTKQMTCSTTCCLKNE